MGQNLDLFVGDGSIESPYITRSFKDEIIFAWYINFKDFLSEDEIKVISPNTSGEIVISKKRDATIFEMAKLPFIMQKAVDGKITEEEINKLLDKLVVRSEKIIDREREPNLLKNALKLCEKYLIEKSSELPLVHSVYKDAGFTDEIGYVKIDNIKAHLEGDLFYYKNYADVRTKIHIKSYLDDFGKVDFFADVKPVIELTGRKFFTKTITKAEQFKAEFEKCYSFLDLATKEGKKVLWEFG